ncbi:MAG: hypothetical protein CFE23_14625 [Flavobacterium sp. BFFFF1]|nr:MAG: hypothetical protein CFE23_14625 [Flavobacterium sp. BFFFF1]
MSFGSCVKEKQVQVSRNYAFVLKVYSENNINYVEADYVQYVTGDRAIEEAKKNGDADTRLVNGEKVYSVPGDFYIVNEHNKIRKLAVSDNVKLDLVSSNDSKNKKELNTFDDFTNDYKDKLFLLTIESEKIIEIEEVFTP